MAMNKTEEHLLSQAGIRLTAVRLMILRHILQHFADAFSLADLEALLPTVGKPTLFRTLTTLADKHILHRVDDGTGMQKYCLCHSHDSCNCEGHVYLTCRVCRKTFCLPHVKLPEVELKNKFIPEEIEYVIKGVCSACAGKKK